MITEKKKQQVEKLSQEAARSGAVVLSDYSGLSVVEIAELRKKLTDLGADFRVVKNTLMRLALEKADLSLPGGLTGPTAVLFSRGADPIESVKVLASFVKEKERGEIRGGFLEKAFLAAEEVLSLAALPGLKALQAQLVFQIASPVHGFSRVLANTPGRFGLVLDQIAKSKGGEK